MPKIKSKSFIELKILPYTRTLPPSPISVIVIFLKINAIINEEIKTTIGMKTRKNKKRFALLFFIIYNSDNKRLKEAIVYVLPYVSLKISMLMTIIIIIRKNMFLQKSHRDKVHKNKNKACEFGL